MSETKEPVYLAISRKAINAAMPDYKGSVDRPFDTPRSENDYYIIAVTDEKSWDVVPTLDLLVKADTRIQNHMSTLTILPISHDTIVALKVTQPELELCRKKGDVRIVDSVEGLVASFHAIKDQQKPRATLQDKIFSYDDLAAKLHDFRKEWYLTHREAPIIGFNSGAYDIAHAAHAKFLEGAKRECDFLVVAIASDKTVREQKGEGRPFIKENARAEHIAGMKDVDAVVISDELYHEQLLDRIRPDKFFKGADYKDVELKGVPEGCKVQIIDAGEGEDPAKHTTAIVERIKGEQTNLSFPSDFY